MIGHFESWLNGLVYELYFPDELHERKLRLFDMTARLVPPDQTKLLDSAKMSKLQELFEQTYDTGSTLRAALFSLRSLELVRIIEEVATQVAAGKSGEES